MPPLFSFVEAIGIIQIVLLIVGLILIVIEMFSPGFGAPGITGLILLVAGIVFTARSLLEALIMIVIILAILGVALTLVLHSASKGRLSKTLILSDSLNKEEGFSGTEDLEYFVGREGKTLTVLRPAGTAEFDGVKLDVVSEGEFIPKNTRVKVKKVTGRRIVVTKI
jgi:membrane-bound ClpP family serine protease